jgi:hypothetical protein
MSVGAARVSSAMASDPPDLYVVGWADVVNEAGIEARSAYAVGSSQRWFVRLNLPNGHEMTDSASRSFSGSGKIRMRRKW